MELYWIWGIGFPFLGTVAGAGLVWCLNWDSARLRRIFSGAAAGVMGAAALVALLIPGLRQSPWALAGAALGAAFLTLPGRLMEARGWLIALAVVLHNIPEGMAAGVSFGSWLAGSVTAPEALAVGLGIGLQNVPDGAMVALPLYQQGLSRRNAFLIGVLSGLVEPLAAGLVMGFSGSLTSWLPVLMGFAAGAMGYVVAAELVPSMELGRGHRESLLWAALGLGLMALTLGW